MNNDVLPNDEAFHNCFFYFVEALAVMTLDAEKQGEAMGNINVAWEIQHDVLDPGAALQQWPGSYLAETEKEEIGRLVAEVRALPPAALLSANQDAMEHIAWANLRSGAARLLKILELPIKRNREFFQKSNG